MKYFAFAVLFFVCLAFFGNAVAQTPGNNTHSSFNSFTVHKFRFFFVDVHKMLFSFCATEVLPGADPCSRGPGYWCATPANAKECKQEDYCDSQTHKLGSK